MINYMQVADSADMIINGYAFTKNNQSIRVLNLNCVVECMHVHASDRKLTESASAKFFVKENGDSIIQNRGILNSREIDQIQKFIKKNYQEMYLKWSSYSHKGFYEK